MSQFRIDTYSALGVKLNPHTQAVSNVRITDRINQIGECEFTLPATVAKQLSVARGLKYKLYHESLGLLGTYTHYDDTMAVDEKTVTVKAYDRLVELANQTAGFGRAFTDQPYASLAAVFTNPFSFTRTYESTFDQTQILPALEIQGESFLRALDVLRQYVRGFFRRDSDTVMHFGDFSATTPVVRLMAPALAFADAGGDYATITQLQRERHGSGVVNRVIPFGAGVGETVVDLRYSSRTTPYTILFGPFYGGVDAYYINDAASVTAYGVVDRVLSFTEVRPITNSAADLENAANAVYDLSVAYLQKNKDPLDIYTASCINLPYTVKVGDLARIDYHGVATLEDETVAWLTLDNQKFFITEIVRDFGESGNPTAQLTLSSSGEQIVGTTEVFTSLMGDVGSLKLRVQPTMGYYNKSSPTLPIAPGRNVEFSFYIGAEMLQINEMKVEFTLMPLRSFTNVVGASTANTTSTQPSSTATSNSLSNDAAGGTSTNTAPVSITHRVGVVTGAPTGTPIYWDGGTTSFNTAAASGYVNTSTESHSHDHSHHHSVDIPSHAHSMAHFHSIEFGVTDDTQSPVGVSVQINGDTVDHIINTATGVDVGTAASGDGLYIVDIRPTLLAQGDFRNKTHTVLFQAVGNQGQIFAQLLSRVTSQPIAVS